MTMSIGLIIVGHIIFSSNTFPSLIFISMDHMIQWYRRSMWITIYDMCDRQYDRLMFVEPGQTKADQSEQLLKGGWTSWSLSIDPDVVANNEFNP